MPEVIASIRPDEELLLPWLALSLTPGLGPTRARHLVEHFGSAAAVLREPALRNSKPPE